MPQVTDDDGDSHVPSITLVDDSTIEIVAVGEVSDQEDKYDTDSGSGMDDDDHDSYPHTTILTRSGRAIRSHFRLALSCIVCTIGGVHIHYLVNDSVFRI